MKTITQTFNVYTFEELSEKAQAFAVEKEKEDRYSDSLYSDMLKESFENILNEKHLPNETIEFSLSYCQGDGVAFYGKLTDEQIKSLIGIYLSEYKEKDEKRVEVTLYNLIENHGLEIEIERNSYGYHYSHENTMAVYITEQAEMNYTAKFLTDFNEWLSAYVKNVSCELSNFGYGFYYKEGYGVFDQKEIAACLKENEEFLYYEDGKFYSYEKNL